MTASAIDLAVERRAATGAAIETAAPSIDGACAAIADRLRAGATLHPSGAGIAAVDAAHVTVEFIHPVTVGKRAVPALTLAPDELLLARDDAVVLGLRIGSDGAASGHLIGQARRRGCLTVDLAAGDVPEVDVDHRIWLGAGDLLVGRELLVTGYHLVWEMVHEHLDATGDAGGGNAPAGLGDLYPFLYDDDATAPSASGHIRSSITTKAGEIADLRIRVLAGHADALTDTATRIRSAADAGGTVWTFGNGGSCTDAQAMAHLLGSERVVGKAIAARSLTDDVATLSALANDVGFDVVFARMLHSLARPGDVAIGLSTSGGSANVLAALDAAHEMGLVTVGFAGYDGGDMTHLDGLDHLFVVPSSSVHRIQEAQTTLAHVLVELTRS